MTARALARRGWTIVARRLRTRNGELDLVARRDRELRVVEVKTRRAPRGSTLDLVPFRPGEAIDRRRRARLARAASALSPALGAERWRLTAAEVLVAGPRRRAEVRLTDLERVDVAAAREVSFPDLRQPNR